MDNQQSGIQTHRAKPSIPMKPVLGISLITFLGFGDDNRDRLVAMLDSFFKSDIMEYPFIMSVVQNGDSMDNMYWLEKELRLKYKPMLKNDQELVFNVSHVGLGMVFSRNFSFYRMFASKKVNYLIEVHNDMVFPEKRKWVTPLVAFMEEHLDYAIISPNIITKTKKKYNEVTEDDYDIQTVGPTVYVANHPDMIRVAYLKNVGFYNEALYPQNWEEVELWYRFYKAGFKVGMHPDSVVYHEKAATRFYTAEKMMAMYPGKMSANYHLIQDMYGIDFSEYYDKLFLIEENEIIKTVAR
jgi:hypothetical protein